MFDSKTARAPHDVTLFDEIIYNVLGYSVKILLGDCYTFGSLACCGQNCGNTKIDFENY